MGIICCNINLGFVCRYAAEFADTLMAQVDVRFPNCGALDNIR